MGRMTEWRKWRNEAKTGLTALEESFVGLNPKNAHLRHLRHYPEVNGTWVP